MRQIGGQRDTHGPSTSAYSTSSVVLWEVCTFSLTVANHWKAKEAKACGTGYDGATEQYCAMKPAYAEQQINQAVRMEQTGGVQNIEGSSGNDEWSHNARTTHAARTVLHFVLGRPKLMSRTLDSLHVIPYCTRAKPMAEPFIASTSSDFLLNNTSRRYRTTPPSSLVSKRCFSLFRR